MNRRIRLFRPNRRKGGERGVRGGRKLKALSSDGFCFLGEECSLHAEGEDRELRRIVSLKKIYLRSVEHTRTRKLPGGNSQPRPGQPGPCPGHTYKGFCAAEGRPASPGGPSARPREGGFQEDQPVAAPGPGDGRMRQIRFIRFPCFYFLLTSIIKVIHC